MERYIFKETYFAHAKGGGSPYFVDGVEYPVNYLEEKVPELLKDLNLKNRYLMLTTKASFEDITETPKTLNMEPSNVLRTIELKEKEDTTETIYINEISFEDLIKIQGVSDKTATKIINTRKEKRFETVEELTKLATTVKWDKYTIVY